jgi:hypothetical protein
MRKKKKNKGVKKERRGSFVFTGQALSGKGVWVSSPGTGGVHVLVHTKSEIVLTYN